MEYKSLMDQLIANAEPLAVLLALAVTASLLLKSNLAKRLKKTLEDMLFSSWQLSLLAATGFILSIASGWTTWDGMRNFTGEPILSGMITFGIQGVMLIVAWLIGESFATGMNVRSAPTASRFGNPASQTWLGALIGLLLFFALFALFMQWRGDGSPDSAPLNEINWQVAGDQLVMIAAALLLAALFALYAASDVIRPYLQGTRVILRNVVLWVMFLACMTTSVFFSFDSLFATIFPQEERVRAAELRAQNQVSGIIADIEQANAKRQAAESEALFHSQAWKNYAQNLSAIAQVATEADSAIERYMNDLIEERRRAVNQQQERMTSAQAGQAGLAARKQSLIDEKAVLTAKRPSLTAEFAEKKADYDEKVRAVENKRVEALAEQKGVEGSGKAGRGPMYRERMEELRLMRETANIAEERMNAAERRLTETQKRLAGIDRELATIDGELATLKGEAETAQTRIKLAEESLVAEDVPKLDPSRIVPSFEKARSEFRAQPTLAKLTAIQNMCGDIANALSATPETKAQIKSLDCDPKATADAASTLFQLQQGIKVFNDTCASGDKLVSLNGADQYFSFARRCLADSNLPSSDTDVLRNEINRIELGRDDKAHRFVVTWNAFQDGNRLAYLALGIAIAIDLLVFMSGLFGANAVRSPLSDVPMSKARSATQLEATINAALGPQPHDTAWLTLNALRPANDPDGFTAICNLSTLDKSTADRVRMVLTAGADIGAVENIGYEPEIYRVRSELREYLSTVCDKHFKTDATAKDRARLEHLVTAALSPHVKEHADIVLHSLEPIRETKGFTSMVSLGEITDAYEGRIIRRVMNAGAAVSVVAPDTDIDDRYYIRPTLYEVLLNLHATVPASVEYISERQRLSGQYPAAIDAGVLREDQPQLELHPKPAELEPPAPALSHQPVMSQAEIDQLKAYYRRELLDAIGLTPELVDERLQKKETCDAIARVSKALSSLGSQQLELGQFLRDFNEMQSRSVENAQRRLTNSNDIDYFKRELLQSVEGQIQDNLSLYNLFPEVGLIQHLITELEHAAGPDDGLNDVEQELKDQLVFVRGRLQNLDLANARSWDEIRHRLTDQAG